MPAKGVQLAKRFRLFVEYAIADLEGGPQTNPGGLAVPALKESLGFTYLPLYVILVLGPRLCGDEK